MRPLNPLVETPGSPPRKFGFGQPLRRVEDQRFITGKGRYTADLIPRNALRSFVLRSPHAHASFQFADLDTARGMKGVRLILTGEDVADLGDLPCNGAVMTTTGKMSQATAYPVLPRGIVRHVGEAVAFIVADTLEQARDAAEAIAIDWQVLPSVTGIAAACKAEAAQVWPDREGNIAFVSEHGDAAKTEQAFARAARTVTITVENNRLTSNFMETRACFATYDAPAKSWTLTVGNQGAHGARDILAGNIFKVARERIRVVCPDVGGGFGTRIFMYREYPLAMVAAQKLKKPVAWVAERTEHFLADAHGRANLSTATMALDEKGRFIGLKVQLDADMGAYLSQYGPFIPWLGGTMTPGCYDIPAVHVRIRGVFTHTTPVDAYRGAGRPEAAYLIERLVDAVARETGKKQDQVRRLNFIKPGAFPHKTQVGPVYDSGEFEGHMRRAMEVADWAGFKQRRGKAQKRGKLRGIGMACYIEACGGGGPESASVTIEKDGSATVLIGTQSNGQGHETAYTQLVSQHLDLAPERIRVVQGDTARIATGAGTGGSRSIPVGGAALASAAMSLAGKLKHLAADVLEAGIGDLELADGAVRVAGTDRMIGFGALAALPQVDPAMLTDLQSWTPPEATYPNGTHVCEVEIDPQTGVATVEAYHIVDDFGVTLNPLLLEGQVMGGVAQGIGQALMENIAYDAGGQILTATLLDYALPRADHLPPIHFETRNVPCRTNALGAKGAGEAGAIGSCPSVMNALMDALYHSHGVRKLDMPATPPRILAAIRAHAT